MTHLYTKFIINSTNTIFYQTKIHVLLSDYGFQSVRRATFCSSSIRVGSVLSGKSAPKSLQLIPQANLENGRFHTRMVTKQIGIWTWKRLFKTWPQRFGFKQPRQKNQMLLLFTYISGLIGAGLLTAIVFRQYSRMSRRAQGIEDIKIRHYGRRPHLFRYRGYVYPDYVVNDLRSIHQFDCREDDIWVVSFPKSGTTWLQEIVYLVINGVDTEKAASGNIEERFPFFEWIYPGLKTLNNMPSPRLLKTHLPLSMLPNEVKRKRPKILYIARNPKDVVVSYYYFMTKYVIEDQLFSGTMEDYCQLFIDDLIFYGPWWKHVKEAWDRREEENILVLFYEDMQQDLRKAVLDVATFLNKPLTEMQVDLILQHCSFTSMKDNKAVNYDWLKDVGAAKQNESFMRKGQVGDWKNHLSQEVIEKLDEVVATKLTPYGVPIVDTLPSKHS